MEAHAAIGAEMALSDADHVGIGINGVQHRAGIHAGQEPGRAVAGARSELEQPAARFRRRQGGQERSHPGL